MKPFQDVGISFEVIRRDSLHDCQGYTSSTLEHTSSITQSENAFIPAAASTADGRSQDANAGAREAMSLVLLEGQENMRQTLL
jgi:hypothetical protein